MKARDGTFGALDGVGQVFVVDDGVVLDEAKVEAVVLCGDLLARVSVPALVRDAAAVVRLIGLDEVLEILLAQRMRLAEGRHVRAQIVEPDFFGIALVGCAAREEEHVRLDALSVEDARRQAQDGVQVAFLHEVAADRLAIAVREQHIVGQDDGGARLAVGLEAAIDVLEEVELLVARRVGEIVARRALAALLRAERRIRQHDIVILEPLAKVGKRVAKEDWPFDDVQHGIHEREAVRVVNELTAGEGLLYLKIRHICREVGVVIRLGLDVLRGGDHEAERAAGGVSTYFVFDTIER